MTDRTLLPLELPTMGIVGHVAGVALGALEVKQRCVICCGCIGVAGLAWCCNMCSSQGEGRSAIVSFYVVCRGKPAVLCVTVLTQRTAWSVLKCALMIIQVTRGAVFGNRLGIRVPTASFQVSQHQACGVRPVSVMALRAVEFGVPAGKRKVGGLVVEPAFKGRSVDAAPTSRVVTVAACTAHDSAVLVPMAGLAGRVAQPGILHIGCRGSTG